MKPIVALLAMVAAVAVTVPAGAEASRPKVLCGNFGGQTMPPRLDRKPARCDITRLSGVASVLELRHMKWTHWNKHPVGQGLVNGKTKTVRLKGTRPCGPHGEEQVYSKMSIDGRQFGSILYCGD
jgi:hypothetical protein